MNLTITTPNGRIGSQVTERLLAAGLRPTLLARNPERVAVYAARGCGVKTGGLEDKEYLVEATKGTDVLFWVTPGDPQSADLRAMQNRMGENVAAAVRTNHIPYVVNLSSMGAHHGKGTGPVDGLHDVEGLLESVAPNIVHLRPAFFMENVLMNMPTILGQGAIFATLAGSTRLPMVATRDIAAAAAARIRAHDWHGRVVKGLHGPADISFEEVAIELGEVLHRKVAYVRITTDALKQALVGAGLSQDMANRYAELYDAAESGWLRQGAEPRSAETATDTTFRQFAQQALGNP